MTTSPFVRDVTRADFDTAVIARSREVLVVADFWAAWCQPCQMLMPLLARLADHYQGRLELAKINTDTERELVAEHGIRSLPTVRLYRHGQVVEEFMGVQSEGVVRELIERHLPRPSDAAVDRAVTAAQGGRLPEALAALRQILNDDAGNDRARLVLARLLLDSTMKELATGRPVGEVIEETRNLLGAVSAERLADAELANLKSRLDLLAVVADAPSKTDLERRIAANANDCQSRYRFGALQMLSGEIESGLDQFLEIVRRDRKFGDDAGRRAMIEAFTVLGDKHPLVSRYRRLLSSALN